MRAVGESCIGVLCMIVFCVFLTNNNNNLVDGQSVRNMTYSDPILLRLNQITDTTKSVSVVGNRLVINVNNSIVLYKYAQDEGGMNISRETTFMTGNSSILYQGGGDISTTSTYTYNNTSYVWSAQSGSAPGFFRYDISNSSGALSCTPNQFNYLYSVTTDTNNSLIYFVDGNDMVIRQPYSLNSTTLNCSGQPNMTWDFTGEHPRKVLLGCRNDIFIVVAAAIFHYGPNSNTSDFNITHRDFIDVRSATFNSDCTVLWVAATGVNKILKYYAPFTGNSTPAEQLSNVYINYQNTTFLQPYDVAVDPKNSRLWIALFKDGAIIGVLTPLGNNTTSSGSSSNTPSASTSTSTRSPTLSSTPSASLSTPSSTSSASISTSTRSPTLSSTPTNSVTVTPSPSLSPNSTFYNDISCSGNSTFCFINSNQTLIISSPLSFNYSVVFVNSSITFTNSSTLTIGPDQVLTSSGNVTVGGQLILHLNSNSSNNITVIVSNFTSGEFSSIVVDQEGNEGCGVTTSQVITQGSLQVLINPNTCGETGRDSGISRGAIAGIVIGSLAGLFIIVAVLVAIGIVVMFMRKKALISL
eukprot:TRINITY_DN454_c0_g1_i2.p1 TRINITY_DN454_c0_g1~~TRINITY_DN454_c0_g1_i2.p1  ORF type:complete len:583 (+),score=72.64 TRINITY_DN454_c0_g1_i2:91-1839(+)